MLGLANNNSNISEQTDFDLLEEHIREMHDTGFSYHDFPAMMDCIRAGDLAGLRQTFTEEFHAYYVEALIDLSLLPLITAHTNGTLFYIATQEGVSYNRGAALSTKYLRNAYSISTKDEFIELYKQMMIDYTLEVFLAKRFHSDSRAVNICLHYIYAHIYENIELKQLSKICGYSISRIQHLMKHYTGMSVTDHIRHEKAEKACFLLKHTDLPCSAISQKLGYCSQSYFITQFKKEYGITPARYRIS